MTLILDTNVLVWATLNPSRLSERVRTLLEGESNTILVSAASAWEIATKVRIGRLPEAVALEQHFPSVLEEAGYVALPLDLATCLRAARLPGLHRDPFDRMIAAHAVTMDIPVLSNDAKLESFGVHRIW